MRRASGLRLYSATALASTTPVIGRYSTSFGMATRLFPARCRDGIRAVYALVRIADEIVDGTAAEAGLGLQDQRDRLDELEAETERALSTGFSANLIVHAFVGVASPAGITAELTRPFFASMRRDLEPVAFEEAEFRAYVHGSAEVVGLMCLAVFLEGQGMGPERTARLREGATRLGAAFQKVNFLRDLADDGERLGRAYLPGSRMARLDEDTKATAVAEIRADLATARAAIPELPRDCRRAVSAATGLFAELLRRIERLPADDLSRQRVSVPAPIKLRILVAACLRPNSGG